MSTALSTDAARGQRSLVDTCAIGKMLSLDRPMFALGVRGAVEVEGPVADARSRGYRVRLDVAATQGAPAAQIT